MLLSLLFLCPFFFFFNDTATTEIYTLSLHDALPISDTFKLVLMSLVAALTLLSVAAYVKARSEEHTSELQSHSDLVCRLLLEKKKKKKKNKNDYSKYKLNYDEICRLRFVECDITICR